MEGSSKKRISLDVDEEMFYEIKNKADEYGLSISAYLRFILKKELR